MINNSLLNTKCYAQPSGLISTSDLLYLTGYKQKAALRRWLDRNGMHYLEGRLGPICPASEFESKPETKASHKEIRFAPIKSRKG